MGGYYFFRGTRYKKFVTFSPAQKATIPKHVIIKIVAPAQVQDMIESMDNIVSSMCIVPLSNLRIVIRWRVHSQSFGRYIAGVLGLAP